MPFRSQRSSWRLVAALILGSGQAVGQTAQTGASQAVIDRCVLDDECISLANSARSLSQAEQYTAALGAYHAAYARQPVPWLLVQMGRMHQKLRHPDEAIRLYQQFLAAPEAERYPEFQESARRYMQEATADLALRQQATTGSVPAGKAEVKPLYRRWWFWTALIGGTVVVTALGVGVGLGLRPRTPQIPDGVSAFEVTF